MNEEIQKILNEIDFDNNKLQKINNNLFLTNNQIETLKRYNINYDISNSLRDLMIKIEDILVIKGGVVDGKVISAADVVTVSKLPNKEGLISMFLGCLQASVRNFACAIKAVADSKAE